MNVSLGWKPHVLTMPAGNGTRAHLKLGLQPVNQCNLRRPITADLGEDGGEEVPLTVALRWLDSCFQPTRLLLKANARARWRN